MELVSEVARWLEPQVAHSSRRPVFAGISAPQGAGKTTLVGRLVPLLAEHGVRAVAVSIDDFYLRREEQLVPKARRDGVPARGRPNLRVALADRG